ncbi:MAG TPA: hypothetical protein VM536_05120, partial [Chloroflexia bacterium]|nr:hypothetical protein [Chloroflexia bacterium]
ALGAWRVLLSLAQAQHDHTEATLEAARDRPLERQIRALVREQRAQNKRSREQEGRGPRG